MHFPSGLHFPNAFSLLGTFSSMLSSRIYFSAIGPVLSATFLPMIFSSEMEDKYVIENSDLESVKLFIVHKT